MHFRLIIDKTKEEEVVVTAHSRSDLTDRIEKLVTQPVPGDRIAAYAEDEVLMLPFEEIECVTVIDGKTYAIDQKNRAYLLKTLL